jgi:signal transduction histidine kinase
VLKAKQAAERESKTKSEFLAVMSHELRTPLNSIVGFSQMLAEEQQGPHANPRYAEYAKSIYQSGCHLTSLINDILDITRFERGSMSLVEQEVDMVELTEICVKMCRQAAEETHVGLVQNYAFTQLEVMGDITRLRQILINLITNAIKFSSPDSSVEVKVERTADGRVAVVVIDAGIGIDTAKLERIFEPFTQVDGGLSRRFGGLGLGLAVARRMARLHGGDVVITSEPGLGTTARLVLPASRVLAATPRPASAEQAA